MRHRVLACDYDGTLASGGHVAGPTVAALRRLRAGGCHLVIVTGRQLHDLLAVFPQARLFDRVVAENGGVLYDPLTHEEHLLGPPPPADLVEALVAGYVQPLSVGRVVVATSEPNERAVVEAIQELGLDHRVISNKGALMVLPPPIDKATGLIAALDELGFACEEAVGVGDAENDLDFLAVCGLSVAVADALPVVRERVDLVCRGGSGEGVAELAELLLEGRPLRGIGRPRQDSI